MDKNKANWQIGKVKHLGMQMSSAEVEILSLIDQDIALSAQTASRKKRKLNFVEALGFSTSPASSKDYFKEMFMMAYSDSKENFDLHWELTSSKGYMKWEEIRHDKETNQGKCSPYDMLYAFTLLPWSPEFKQGADISKHFLHLWKKHYSEDSVPYIPALSSLKQLQGSDTLVNGMWIILVRMPRPCHGKPHIPLSLRKDYCRFSGESEAEWQGRKNELKKKAEGDVHPTEGQLFLTLNNTLIQEVAKNIVCAKCGAKGHHHEKSHDDVYCNDHQVFDEQYAWNNFLLEMEDSNLSLPAKWIKYRESGTAVRKIQCNPEFPAWMNVLPFPKESITLTKLLTEEKGLVLQIRQAETKIPLRLARKLMMDGLHIEGDVYASGVGTRKRVRREEEEEAQKLRITSLDLQSSADKASLTLTKEFEFIPLQINIEEEEIMDMEFRSSSIRLLFQQNI
jgi:hypothetical protein